MPTPANTVILAGLLIGLVYGSVGLLSGFCLMSSLRGWWAQGDSRLVRTYALAMGVAIAATQLLAVRQMVDLGKSIYLQPSFSVAHRVLGWRWRARLQARARRSSSRPAARPAASRSSASWTDR